MASLRPKCVCVGPKITLGQTVLFSDKSVALYTTVCDDFILVTNSDFTPFIDYLPDGGLKNALASNWHYVLHISHGHRIAITRDHLRARIAGGQIIAYQYTECSIEGNECVYYGFLPTYTNWSNKRYIIKSSDDDIDTNTTTNSGEQQQYDGTHRTCLISSCKIWPRQLIVFLERECGCDCSPKCSRWSVRLRDTTIRRRVCGKNIPWSEVYVMMGDLEANSGDSLVNQMRQPRFCPVCAQCIKCSTSPIFCRKHRRCKHKSINVFDSDGELTNIETKDCIVALNNKLKHSKIKQCLRIKN